MTVLIIHTVYKFQLTPSRRATFSGEIPTVDYEDISTHALTEGDRDYRLYYGDII